MGMTPEAQATKAKIGKRAYIKLKRFYTRKETINIVKSQPTEWERIFANFANYVFDKGLITKICKYLSELNIFFKLENK